MSFNTMSLPQSVQNVFYNNSITDWNVLYWAARNAGISDTNKIADLLFYHAHKELVFPGGSMALQPGIKNYNSLVAEWKKYKQFAQSLAHGTPETTTTTASQDFLDDLGVEYEDLIYGKPAEGWTSHALGQKIQESWGREVADYCRKKPSSETRPSAAIFSLSESVSTHLGTAIVWKCRSPREYCNCQNKIMVVGLLRSEKDYWLRQTANNAVKSAILCETAQAAVRDYRRWVVAHQMCPPEAYQKLYSLSQDATYQMFLGMFRLLSPQNASPVGGNMYAGGRSVGNAVSSQVTATSSVPNYVYQIVSFTED
ncbi:hypothetical protein ABVF61_07690 [Roseibium sp. HPY-6]|uniref:hypothetical protein n=1 Tax=Roseibium sp. HPY-6 TaxID=3229852 RepID=UPI00338E551D